MLVFAAVEHHHKTDHIFLAQEFFNLAYFHVQIVRSDARFDAQLFQGYFGLFLFGLRRFLSLFVNIPVVIKYFTDRRLGVG